MSPTTTINTKPVLFLDVDGVLNRDVPNGQDHDHCLRSYSLTVDSMRVRVHLDPGDRTRLLGAAEVFDLAWGTSWEGHANTLLCPLLDIPTLPVATWEPGDPESKVPGIIRVAAGRPFVWIDDAITQTDHALLSVHPRPHLGIETDPVVGLTDEHLDTAHRWVRRQRLSQQA